MQLFLAKIKEQANKLKALALYIPILNRWFAGAMFLCFVLSFVFILLLFGRYNAITQIREEINRLHVSLEYSDIDIAYDNIDFNIWWPMPIVTVKNLKIYSKYEPVREWNIEELQINTSLIGFHTLSISLSSQQNIVLGDKTYSINMPTQNIYISYCIQTGIKEILADINNLQIKGIVNIAGIKFGAQRMSPQPVNDSSPFMETHLMINNIKFAEELNVPLSHQIDKLYINANMIGNLQTAETYRESIFDWLAKGGKFEIEKSSFEWKPLIMVSRGDLYFNEKLEPKLHLSASSRALLHVMDIMEEAEIFDRKGVFVSRILLRNKAFKMSENDEYDTVLTPIDYENGKLSIENIPVASWSKTKQSSN